MLKIYWPDKKIAYQKFQASPFICYHEDHKHSLHLLMYAYNALALLINPAFINSLVSGKRPSDLIESRVFYYKVAQSSAIVFPPASLNFKNVIHVQNKIKML